MLFESAGGYTDDVAGRADTVARALHPPPRNGLRSPTSNSTSSPTATRKIRIIDLLRPHWKALTLALVAVAGEAATDLLEPWPLKIVLDYLLQSKPLPGWMAGIVGWIGQNKLAVLNFAVVAVAVIAVVGALSSYLEKYLTTSVGQWVMHDLRRTLYHHIHRLSLAEHDEKRTGDLIGRVTSDIEAIQDVYHHGAAGHRRPTSSPCWGSSGSCFT